MHPLVKAFHIVHGVLREHAKKLARSPLWPGKRRAYLLKNPTCKACGGKRLLQVHHIEPFHLEPALELEEKNFIGFCIWKLCHLLIGHSGNFKGLNPHAVADAAECLAHPERRNAIIARAAKAIRFTE